MEKDDNAIDFSAFLASSVHDMKNSLAMLLNSLNEVVVICAPRDCPSRKLLSQMQYEATRVNNDLIQLLTLYKMNKGRMNINISDYPVIDVLEECVLQNRPLLDYRGIELLTECSDDLAWFFDRNLISGVINNVLNNAYRYAKERIKIRAVQNNGWFVISIEDDGAGYPEEFLQAGIDTDSGVSFRTGSTGLGLFFASMVAKAHKNKKKEGFISVSNGGEYGGGCFTITLP